MTVHVHLYHPFPINRSSIPRQILTMKSNMQSSSTYKFDSISSLDNTRKSCTEFEMYHVFGDSLKHLLQFD